MASIPKKVSANLVYIIAAAGSLLLTAISLLVFIGSAAGLLRPSSSFGPFLQKFYPLLLFSLQFIVTGAFLYIHIRVIRPLRHFGDSVSLAGDAAASATSAATAISDLQCTEDVRRVSHAYLQLATLLQERNTRVDEQTAELFNKNWELMETNMELEASYAELQSVVDQLNEAEQKYHSLVKNLPEVICVVDSTGVISFINHKCVQMLGYVKSELIGRTFVELIDENSHPFSIETIAGILKKRNSITIELFLKKKDGTIITTEAGFTNSTINGMVSGLQAIVRDVTQRKHLQEEILSSNKRLAILNSVSKSLASTLDLEELSKTITSEVAYSLGFSGCVLGVLDSETGIVEARSFSGPFFQSIDSSAAFSPVSIHDEVYAKVLTDLQVLPADKLPAATLMWKINAGLSEDEKIREIASIPLKIKDQYIGVVMTLSTAQITPADLRLLTSLANNVAVALNNAMLFENSKKYFFRTIDTLVAAIEAKDKYTKGHSKRVSEYAVHIGEKMKLSKEQLEDIKLAGILHDIGKIGISDNILLKAGKLTSEEYNEVKQHPAISRDILRTVGLSDRALKAISYHHERFDGKGYPFMLQGEDIPVEAQIIAVADAYDAMTSNRPYRRAMDGEAAIRELVENKLSQFSPEVVDAMVEICNRRKR